MGNSNEDCSRGCSRGCIPTRGWTPCYL
jgi:hypothetical protein